MRALIAAAGLAALAAAYLPGTGLALAAVCHQHAARSFAGAALCARCTGLYAGLLLGAALPLWRRAGWTLAAAAAAAGAWLFGIDSSHVRLALGAALGWSEASYLITLAMCPNSALAAPNCRPARASATNAAGRCATSR